MKLKVTKIKHLSGYKVWKIKDTNPKSKPKVQEDNLSEEEIKDLNEEQADIALRLKKHREKIDDLIIRENINPEVQKDTICVGDICDTKVEAGFYRDPETGKLLIIDSGGNVSRIDFDV